MACMTGLKGVLGVKKDKLIKNHINTNADLTGIGLQKARAAERLLQALFNE